MRAVAVITFKPIVGVAKWRGRDIFETGTHYHGRRRYSRKDLKSIALVELFIASEIAGIASQPSSQHSKGLVSH
jgi:hypothetical protein